ncbi:unnamed protein product [Linum tenue]|uniref:Uncharacterized protein n=1 Tax=Linum tenue TaxID=586396 RepID=A0AAV0K8H4_9ROSI|nr:unnamed protein product [Linum tenue]
MKPKLCSPTLMVITSLC